MAELSAQLPPTMRLPQDPIPIREVRVQATADVIYDLKKVQQVLPNILGRLGCPACCSGFDIRFVLERDLVVDPRTLEVRGLGQIGR